MQVNMKNHKMLLIGPMALVTLLVANPVTNFHYPVNVTAKAATGDYSDDFDFDAGDKINPNQGPGDSLANSIANSAQNSMADQLSSYGDQVSQATDRLSDATKTASSAYHYLSKQKQVK